MVDHITLRLLNYLNPNAINLRSSALKIHGDDEHLVDVARSRASQQPNVRKTLPVSAHTLVSAHEQISAHLVHALQKCYLYLHYLDLFEKNAHLRSEDD